MDRSTERARLMSISVCVWRVSCCLQPTKLKAAARNSLPPSRGSGGNGGGGNSLRRTRMIAAISPKKKEALVAPDSLESPEPGALRCVVVASLASHAIHAFLHT